MTTYLQILGIAVLAVVGFRMPKGSKARTRIFTALKAWITVFAFWMLFSHEIDGKSVLELIIEKVYNSGGNFVTQDFSSSQVRWERLGGETLRLRVSQAFRNNRRRLPPAQGGKPR